MIYIGGKIVCVYEHICLIMLKQTSFLKKNIIYIILTVFLQSKVLKIFKPLG